jgi:hypothetical protein
MDDRPRSMISVATQDGKLKEVSRENPREGLVTRRGASADWWNFKVVAGLLFAGIGIWTGPWPLIPLGLALAAFGGWTAMQRLDSPSLPRRLAWVAVDGAAMGGAIALALVLDGVARWVVIGAAVLAAGPFATRLTGVREAR